MTDLTICSPHCGVSPETGSGGEVYERELLKGLAQRGVKIQLVLADGAPVDASTPNWVIERAGSDGKMRWFQKMTEIPRAIQRFAKRDPFQILRAHSLRYIGPYAWWAKKRYRLPQPFITHHHHLDPNIFNPIIEKPMIMASDCVITDSQFSYKQMQRELGIDVAKVRVEPVYCGVSERFQPGPKSEKLLQRHNLQGKKIVLHHSSLKARKNQGFLLRMFAKVKAALGNQVCLLMVGGGELEKSLKHQARSLGIGNEVCFTGYVQEDEKMDYLRLGDVYVFSSLLEGFPLAPQEAMACGVPAVVLDAASLGEQIVDGETGFLVPPSDVDLFAKRVVALLQDEPLRQRLGNSTKERIDKHFRWDRTVDRILDIYQDTVRQHRSIRS